MKFRQVDLAVIFLSVSLLGCGSVDQSSSVEEQVRELTADSASERWSAAATLGYEKENIEIAIDVLIGGLSSEDEYTRAHIVQSLGNVGAGSSKTAKALVEALTDSSELVREMASRALGQLGSEAVPVILKKVSNLSPDDIQSFHLIQALGHAGPEAHTATTYLAPLVDEGSPRFQIAVIEALGEIGPGAEAAVPSLKELIEESDWEIIAYTAQALGKIGPASAPAIPELIALLGDPDNVVRQQAATALGRIGEPAAPALIKSLDSDDWAIRTAAVAALGWMPPETDNVLPAIRRTLRDQDPQVLQSASKSLHYLGAVSIPEITKDWPSLYLTKQSQIPSIELETIQKIASDLQSDDASLTRQELEQGINYLSSTVQLLDAPKSRFLQPTDATQSIRNSLSGLRDQRNARNSGLIIKALLWGFGFPGILALSLFWVRPELLLSISKTLVDMRDDRQTLDAGLSGIQQFFHQAGAKTNRQGSRSLQVLAAPGRLSAFTPIPVVLAADQPAEQDVADLAKLANRIAGKRQQQAAILVYKDPPDTLFRMRMAEVRLSQGFILIPIPLAAIEQSRLETDSAAGLLAQYTDRYLPGADLFDDRNAIGDTLTFFGRGDLLQRLATELRRSQGIGLFGLRKSGKTSILLQLGFAMRHHPTVHIDLQPYGGRPLYGAELFNQILLKLHQLAHDKKRGPSFKPFDLDTPAPQLTGRFQEQINQLTTALTQAGYELPIICFLDEIERIIPTPADPSSRAEEFNAFFGVLRALSQEQKQLSLLIADVHPDCNRISQWPQADVPTNPVFSFFKEVFVAPFSPEETEQMLKDIGNFMGIHFDADTLAQIHHRSGGHPFVTRQLASLLYTKLGADGQAEIGLSNAAKYLDRPFIYSGVLKDYFGKNIWEDLEKRGFDGALKLLRLTSCNTDKVGSTPDTDSSGLSEQQLHQSPQLNLTQNDLLDALLWSESVGLIQRTEKEDRETYDVRVPLLSDWIRMQMRDEEIQQWKIL